MDVLAFYILAFLTVLCSLLVVVQRNPMYSVVLLIASFGALAGLYILLDAPFTAVTQIIIYAGAIMVLFLFVVMLLNVPREESTATSISALVGPTGRRVGAVLALVFGIEIVWALSRTGVTWFPQDAAAESVNSVARIGAGLFRDHVFAFEATSILILVAMLGAVVLARRER